MPRPMLAPLALLLALAAPLAAADAPSILPNVGFEAAADGKPAGWGLAEGVTWQDETNHFLRFQAAGPGHMVMQFNAIPMKGIKALHLSYSVRWAGVKSGKDDWNDARIILEFKDAKGQGVAGGPGSPRYVGSSEGWKRESLRFRVPAGAVTLNLMPCMFEAAAGTMDLDDCSLVPIDPATVPALVNARGEETVVVDAGGKAPDQLTVAGNQVLGADAKPVWLQGVNVPSLDWSNQGERVLPAIVCAVEQWKASLIRLPVSPLRWFGREKGQGDGGADYRGRVDQAVLACASRGVHVIVDLHRYRAPEALDVEFWTDAAAHFKDQPAVLFGLLNEPHGTTWEIWRNGGEITDRSGDEAKGTLKVTKTTSVGMQALVAAARGTGAKNVLVAAGLDWAYDLSGMLNGFALEDLGGHGIIYDSHCYSWKTDWKGKFVDVSEKYAVLLGECGAHNVPFDWLPKGAFEDPYTWVPDMLGLIQARHLHWTGWSFHPGASPCLLSDWSDKSFTPTPWWGAFARAALAGGQFSCKRMR